MRINVINTHCKYFTYLNIHIEFFFILRYQKPFNIKQTFQDKVKSITNTISLLRFWYYIQMDMEKFKYFGYVKEF